MSAFSTLFGTAKQDEGVSQLLSKSAKPLKRSDLKARTVIDVPVESTSESDDEEEQAEESEAEEEVNDDDVSLNSDEEDEQELPPKKRAKTANKKDVNEDIEAEYFARMSEAGPDENADENADQTKDSKPEADESSAASKNAAAPTRLEVKARENEKSERTVFVGNVVAGVLTSKTVVKAFKEYFSTIGPVESVRFRLIAFSKSIPRKFALAEKALHETRDSVNAYVVYKTREDSRAAASKLNATVFDNLHLRVDHVTHPAPKDNKRTVFVGNLDFDENEETLWKHFNKHTGNDTESVRIVRDAKTNIGKGFAYVMFKDSLSVNKALMLHDKPIAQDDAEPAKKSRKLRIMRAKANAKPSEMSPNHASNLKRTKTARSLTESQKMSSRVRSALGNPERRGAGNAVGEGVRATKGQNIKGVKKLKTALGRVKKPRTSDRVERRRAEREAKAAAEKRSK